MTLSVAVVGDRADHYVQQDTIAPAIDHAAAAAGLAATTTWLGTDTVSPDPARAAEQLADFDAMWCAPGSPYLSIDGALAAIRVAREREIPFLGTCAGFQHGVLEFARHVLGRADAGHAEYGPDAGAELFVDALACSLVGQTARVTLTDGPTQAAFAGDATTESYFCSFGLDESRRPELAAAGLHVGGVDADDGTTRVMHLRPHPFFFLTLFVPQARSAPGAPHPLIAAFIAAASHSGTVHRA